MVDFWYEDPAITWQSMTRLKPEAAAAALPEIESVEALDLTGTLWRVTFVSPLVESKALSCAGAYELVGASGKRPRVLRAVPESGSTPSYVDLTTEEHEQDESYTLTMHIVEVA